MTNLTIISAQYLYSHSQNFLVTFCVPIGTCAKPTPNKTYRQKWLYKTDMSTYFEHKHSKLDLVALLSFLGRTLFEKDFPFVKLAHEFKNMPEAKFQNQWSFTICYHSLAETLITSTLLCEIATFVNTQVRQLTDLMDTLSTPALQL